MSTIPELFPTSNELKRCVVRAFKKRHPARATPEDLRSLLENISEEVISLCYSIRNSLKYGDHFFLTVDGDRLEPLILKNFVRFRIHCLPEDEDCFSKEMALAFRQYAERPPSEQRALVLARLVVIDSRVAVLSLRVKPTVLIEMKSPSKRANVVPIKK